MTRTRRRELLSVVRVRPAHGPTGHGPRRLAPHQTSDRSSPKMLFPPSNGRPTPSPSTFCGVWPPHVTECTGSAWSSAIVQPRCWAFYYDVCAWYQAGYSMVALPHTRRACRASAPTWTQSLFRQSHCLPDRRPPSPTQLRRGLRSPPALSRPPEPPPRPRPPAARSAVVTPTSNLTGWQVSGWQQSLNAAR
jgi:hypothetical protein